mgnify:CR=1 FL=1
MGIKGRVLLLTLLPTSLMASLLGGYFTWMQLSELQAQLLQRGEMIAEQLAPLVAPAMSSRNTDLLERIATQSLEQTDVRTVAFLAPDRTPLAHAGPTMLHIEDRLLVHPRLGRQILLRPPQRATHGTHPSTQCGQRLLYLVGEHHWIR